ncbi:hypothetical protein, partial [Thermus sp.]|uniref:hypothetical protein n=1 Tax=Thermus sp. TaxID=275 RepID=UPI003D149B2A
YSPTKVASQAGNGAWQAVASPGSSVTINLPAGEGRYGVAFTCGNGIRVVQLTKGEAASPTLTCEEANVPTPVTVSIGYDASALSGVSVVLYSVSTTGLASGNLQSNPSNVSVPPGKGDLLLTAIGTGQPIAMKALYDQNFTSGATFNVTFSASDQMSGTGTINSYTVPAGGGEGGAQAAVFHVTPKGALGVLGFSSTGGASFSFPLPPSGLQGQRVFFGSFLGLSNNLTVFQAFSGTSYTPQLPPLFSPTADTSGALPKFSGLSVSGSSFLGYGFHANWSGGALDATVSAGWIGNTTSYTMPDLSGAGFANAKPAQGTQVTYSADAVYGNKPLNTFLGLGANFGKLLAVSGIDARVASTKPNTYIAP